MTVTTNASAAVHAHFTRTRETSTAFFTAEVDAIVTACESLAARFAQGGTLFVAGAGARATDAHHVSVEFVHPVVVGKRALPAMALTSDSAAMTAGATADPAEMFAGPLRALARRSDAVFALTNAGDELPITRLVAAARELGLWTCVFSSGRTRHAADAVFSAGTNALVAQEVHETTYHVLWELVHVFLDHDARAGAEGPGATAAERALYPFLFDDATRPLDGVRHEVRESILAKSLDIHRLRDAVEAAQSERIAAAARDIAERIRRGGRLFAFGNGGSATDAQDVAVDCVAPPVPGWRPVPAVALTNDVGVLTAVANDVGFGHVYARQIAAFAGPDDVAIGFSTSGQSASVVAALEVARSRGLLTVALIGGSGGPLSRPGAVDVCLAAPSDYTPRIQEAHATIWHALWSACQEELGRA